LTDLNFVGILNLVEGREFGHRSAVVTSYFGKRIREPFWFWLVQVRESEVFNLPLIFFRLRDISFSAGFAGKLICSDSLTQICFESTVGIYRNK